MNVRKSILCLIAFVALAGVINCTLIEPALASQSGHVICETDDQHSSFLCHSVHHQWAPFAFQTAILNDAQPQSYLHLSTAPYLESPAGSIFHPPQLI